jgi:hypothetical protein
MELEEEFAIDIADEDAKQIHSVSDAIRLIDERRRSSAALVAQERRIFTPETTNPAVTAQAGRIASGIIERIAAAFAIAGLVVLAVAYIATGHIVHAAASGNYALPAAIIWADAGYIIALFCGVLGIALACCVVIKLGRMSLCTRVALWAGLLDVLLPFLIVV